MFAHQKIIGIIPARYASTRFPGKPLVKIGDKTMIERVYEKVKSIDFIDEVLIATDDERIMQHALSINAKAIYTSDTHQSGTDRCGEVMQHFEDFEVVINIQGDEPFVQMEQLKSLIACFENPDTQIATLIKKINSDTELFNINTPKVVVNKHHEAIYFSRNTIPYLRNIAKEDWLSKHIFYKHIGIYAYKTQILKELVQLPIGILEQAESLEQLRWIENSYRIQTAITDIETLAIDTPEDLEKANQYLSKL